MLPDRLFRTFSPPSVEIERQVLTEKVQVLGTAFSLAYRSDRLPGRKTGSILKIALTGKRVARRVKEVVLELEVAGRRVTQRFPPQPDQIYTFVWDGKDANGKPAGGPQRVNIRIGYLQRAFYPRPELTRWSERTTGIGADDTRMIGLGGWSLTPHHTLDLFRNILYLGDGSRRAGAVDLAALQQRRTAADGPFPSTLQVASPDRMETFVFDTKGRHLSTLDAAFGVTRFRFDYDTEGRLAAVTDGDGGVTRIVREAGKLAIIAPTGQRTELALGADGYTSSITDPGGHAVKLQSTGDGLLQVFTDPNGNSYRFSYDDEGRLIRRDEPDGGFTSYASRSADASKAVAVITALGRETIYQRERLDSGGERRRNTCCGGRVTETLRSADRTETIHHADGTVLQIRTKDDTEESVTKTPSGLTRRVSRRQSASSSQVTINGRTSTVSLDVTRRERLTKAPGVGDTVSRFDESGRIVEKIRPGRHPVRFVLDRGRLTRIEWGTGPDSRITSIEYNTAGQASAVTDPANRVVRLEYDNCGLLVRQVMPSGAAIEFRYDANGNRTAVIPPHGHAHTFERTAVNLLNRYLSPGGEPFTYRYDTEHRLIAMVRPDRTPIEYQYDALGQLASVRTPSGVESIAFDMKTGRITSVTSAGGVVVSYDYDGFLLQRLAWTGLVQGEVTRSYDDDFRIRSEAVNGVAVEREYGADGRLARIGEMRIRRDPVTGRVSETTLGKVRTVQKYNGFDELESFRAFAEERLIYSFELRHDALGRVVEKDESIEGEQHRFAYEYDVAGRLSALHKDSVLVARYDYDSNGNRLRAEDAREAKYDARDQVVRDGDVEFRHNENGERIGSGSNSYTYDAFGNLTGAMVGARHIEYILDGERRRLGKKVDGQFAQGFLYRDLITPIAEIDAQHRVISRFVFGQRANVADYLIKDGVPYRILPDPLGSPRLIVNAADGTPVQRIDYDAFGNILLDTNPRFQPFGFAGGIHDRDTGLVHFGARDYDPRTGRWTTPDPARFAGGDANLYAYVGNDPVNFSDPVGLWEGFFPGMCGSWHHQRNRIGGNICPPNMPDPYSGPRECPEKWQSTGWHQEPTRSPTHGYNWSFRHDSGSQCVYDGNGNLVTDPEYEGSYDYVNPFNSDGSLDWWGGAEGHFFADMLPWIVCGN